VKVYFTQSHQATKQERAEANRRGAVLVNGMFGDGYNRECSAVYGNAPKHLKHLLPKKRKPKEAADVC